MTLDPMHHRDPAWTSRWLAASIGLMLLWPLLLITEFQPARLLSPASLAEMGRFLQSFLPPRVDAEFLALLASSAWKTVAMATAGLALALVVAIPMAILTTERLSIGATEGRMHPMAMAARQLLRGIMAILRSVPELVWALMFVRVVGLGPTAGVLAIAITYSGMLGKVYAEILESGPPEACRSLIQSGAGRLQALTYGLIPQNATELISYTVYRWECAIRSSVVLGFVGAGGLGQELEQSMAMFAGGEVASILLVFIGLVALADLLSRLLRRPLDAP